MMVAAGRIGTGSDDMVSSGGKSLLNPGRDGRLDGRRELSRFSRRALNIYRGELTAQIKRY
jgi:hypothetical protein